MKHQNFLIVPVFLLLVSLAGATQPPILPVIDRAMRTELRNVYLNGIAMGNQPSVFAKVGDSITHSRYFLLDIGCSVEMLASYQQLAPTIDFFRNTAFPDAFTTAWCGKANSFSRDSITAANGWTAAEPLTRFPNPISVCPTPDNNPLRCEIRLIQPSIALIMLGTNDLEENDPKKFRRNLSKVVQETIIAGVVPVLSTIPPRLDDPVMGRRVGPYNQIIQQVADTLQVPLWNYWAVLTGPGMIHQGMDSRGIHPSVYNGIDSTVFASEALRYGFNQRNLTALEVLKKVKMVVEQNGPADVTSSPNFAIFPVPLATTVQRGKIVTLKIPVQKINTTVPVTLTLKAPPAGISGIFVMNTAGTSAILTLSVRSGVPTGNYRITVRGSNGTSVRTTTFALKVHN